MDTAVTFRPSASLRHTPLRAWGFAALFAVLAFCYRWLGGQWPLTGLFIAATVLFAAFGAYAYVRLPKAAPALTIGPDGITLTFSGRHRSIAWADLTQVGLEDVRLSSLRHRWLVVGWPAPGTPALTGLPFQPAHHHDPGGVRLFDLSWFADRHQDVIGTLRQFAGSRWHD
jgi:hypothetical protein